MASFSTLLYIADPDDAETIGLDSDEDAAERWRSLWLRHLGDLELVRLGLIVASAPDELGGTLMAELLYQAGDEGPFVMRVPQDFVASIAKIPDSRIAEVAAAWNQFDELKHWKRQELVETVSNLREFFRAAVASGKSVLQVASL